MNNLDELKALHASLPADGTGLRDLPDIEPEPATPNKRDLLAEIDEEFLCADGFDDAIIGHSGECVVYDIDKCTQILVEGGMDYDEAVEYFHFNVEGSYVGTRTPIWTYVL